MTDDQKREATLQAFVDAWVAIKTGQQRMDELQQQVVAALENDVGVHVFGQYALTVTYDNHRYNVKIAPIKSVGPGR